MTCLFLAWFFWTISIETLASYNGIGSSSWGLKWNSKKCWWAPSEQQEYRRTDFGTVRAISLLKTRNSFIALLRAQKGKAPKQTGATREWKEILLAGGKKGVVGRVLLDSSCYPALREGIFHSHLFMGIIITLLSSYLLKLCSGVLVLARVFYFWIKKSTETSTSLTWKSYLIISPWHLLGWVSKRTVKEQ